MTRDLEIMEYADGERGPDGAGEGSEAAAKVAGIRALGELVRGRLELAADEVPDAKFDALWREIDKKIAADVRGDQAGDPSPPGFWRRLTRVIEHYRGHILVGAVSAGAVGAVALFLRPSGDGHSPGRAPIDAHTVGHRSAEIDDLNTPGGVGTVFYLDDEDGGTTVIWVTPDDTVEGI